MERHFYFGEKLLSRKILRMIKLEHGHLISSLSFSVTSVVSVLVKNRYLRITLSPSLSSACKLRHTLLQSLHLPSVLKIVLFLKRVGFINTTRGETEVPNVHF